MSRVILWVVVLQLAVLQMFVATDDPSLYVWSAFVAIISGLNFVLSASRYARSLR
ncbi:MULTISPECIES: hypothetical protein [Luteimonas]|uniref:hypothetical protein n=1 Tax=Luteimonas TaxID=83614 RepID=UPI0013045B36|nr:MULTISPECIES: hypothetical protein [Luteimonas]